MLWNANQSRYKLIIWCRAWEREPNTLEASVVGLNMMAVHLRCAEACLHDSKTKGYHLFRSAANSSWLELTRRAAYGAAADRFWSLKMRPSILCQPCKQMPIMG